MTTNVQVGSSNLRPGEHGNPNLTGADLNFGRPPRQALVLCIRFSVSPDGQSLLYPALSVKTGLWMLEGFQQP